MVLRLKTGETMRPYAYILSESRLHTQATADRLAATFEPPVAAACRGTSTATARAGDLHPQGRDLCEEQPA